MSARLRAIRASDWWFVIVQFALSRVLYLGVGIATTLLVAAGPTERLADLAGPAWDALRSLLVHGDSVWYRRIVEDGYTAMPFDASEQRNWAFFPLYPALVVLTGGSVAGGIILANLFGLAAARLLMAEVRAGWGRIIARWTILFLLFQPFSGMFSSFRPESLLLFFAVGAWVAGRRGHWWLAWLCVGLATLTRSQGVLVALLLIDPLWAQRDALRKRPWPVILGPLLPIAALAGFSGYMGWLTGDPLAWARIQAAWGRAGFDPLGLLDAYWPPLFVRYSWDFALLNSLILAGALGCAVALLHLRRYGEALFTLAWAGGAAAFGASTIAMGRYVTTIFPIPLVLAAHPRLRRFRVGILVTFAALLAGVGAWIGLGLRAVMP
jgi:hypothetical protein